MAEVKRPRMNGNKRATSTIVHLHVRKRWLAAFAAILIAPWFAVLWMVGPWRASATNVTVSEARVQQKLVSVEGERGPWGQLQLTEIKLAPPRELIDWFRAPETMTPWHFPDHTLEELQTLFANVPCTDQQRYQILQAVQPAEQINGYIIKPPVGVIASLSPDARARIYNRLCVYDENINQMNASRFRGQSIDDWFAGSGLSEEVIARVEPLIYRNGHFLFFADLPLVLHDLSPEDRDLLISVLAREMTYLARIRIEADTDIEDVANYWGRGGRRKDVGPLLESLTRIEGGASIDIAHLLPGFARRYLYTYPIVSAALLDGNTLYSRDCHWTAANFFNDVIDDRYAKAEEYRNFIEENFYEIFHEPMMGDLVVYEQGGVAYHSAVYLADDLVFTKNGSKLSRPWMLLRMDEMKDFYPRPPEMGAIQIHYMRRKDI